jgi:adenylate kinase
MDATVVSGVPGAGRSAVAERARRRLGDDYELVNFGDVMLEAAVARGLARDRAALAELPIDEYHLLQRRAASEIGDRSGTAQIVVTHLAVRTTHGFLPGLPDPAMREIGPDRFVLIEADAGVVVERREASEYRRYPDESPADVEFHRDLERAAAAQAATRAQVPVVPIRNDGALDDAVEAFVDAIDG